jgi:hypothetical protein
VDVIVVDERDRLPIGRPCLSLAIDVATRTVPGFCVSLEPPSTISVALVLTHAVLPKDASLADRKLRIPWPVAGLPEALYLDNASEFHAEPLTRAAQEYGIRLEYRPRLKYEGRRTIDERLIFATILEQVKLVEAARCTARQRRAIEGTRPLLSLTSNPPSAASKAEVSKVTHLTGVCDNPES